MIGLRFLVGGTKRADVEKHLNQARTHLNKGSIEGKVRGKDGIDKLINEISVLEKKLAGEGSIAESELKG